ncbi:MAG: proline dehydrogenase family protein [Ignavibacteriae bacterium]|nr:proline dehydrogenase family protein [Ignavibacteriota bacterium]
MSIINQLVVKSLPLVPKPLVRYFANRYIAGETLADAVRCVRQINAEGACATLDVLGEDIFTKEEAVASRNGSIEVLEAITREKLDSNLSIKLTSLGLKLDKNFTVENVREILKVAAQNNIFVRFDMEDSTCTTDTIDVFRTLHKEFPNTGIVLQAYLFRTEADTKSLMNGSMKNFRLCKGIYRESPGIAFQSREEVQQNYLKVLKLMLETKSYVGIATHDTVLVDGANKLIVDLGLKKNEYEFQMLLGVRPELRNKLVKDGHKVRLYVPFGQHWYGYSVRRFKENPEIAGYVARAVFTRNR